MQICCWGARGSTPVSGPDVLKYGGDTCCVEIRTTPNVTVIVDAGTGIRALGKALFQDFQDHRDHRDYQHYQNPVREIHLLFTHAHWDHIIGFPFFQALYSAESRIFLYGGLYQGVPVTQSIIKTLQAPHFPVNPEHICAHVSHHTIGTHDFNIHDLGIRTIPLNHPNGGLGYRFTYENASFVFLTDNELGDPHPEGRSPKDYVDFAKDADLLFHDAEYTPDEYKTKNSWGHSSYSDAIDLAVKAHVKTLGLFHHNQDRSDRALEHILENARSLIKERGAMLTCALVGQDSQFTL